MKKLKYLLTAITAALVAGAFVACTPTESTANSSSTSESVEPSKTTYTVSFESNGGTEIAPIEVEEGEAVDLSAYIMEKEDYYFYSWCFDEALKNRTPSNFIPEADVTLYAEWGQEEKYLLSFETGDGSSIESVLYAPNAYLVQPEDPTLENYAFGGWYRDAEYTREFNFFSNTMPRRNVTVYAKWTELFAIHFDSNGGSEVESLQGEVGEAVSAPEAPVKEGHVFEGWFEDKECTKAYEISTIPEKTLTVYAGWHERQTDITVRLHLNHDAADEMLTVSGNEGEELVCGDALDRFQGTLSTALKPYFLDQTVDTVTNPVYKFNGWTLDASGKESFDGVLPQCDDGLDLYATWARSSMYCEVKFLATEAGEPDDLYYVVKNTTIDDSVLSEIEKPLQEKYELLGCEVDGFYTSAGLRYVSGQKVVMDMELSPYLYSMDLVYEYMGVSNASGNTVNGYVVMGYAPDSTNKDKESLLLAIPEYYDDGENGSAAVLWIYEKAFADYPITEAKLPKRLMGIGAEAFKNTKIASVELPSPVFEIDDYAFADCDSLASVTFKGSSIAWLGSKIFLNTPYEASMACDEDGFVFFDQKKTIIYGYKGTASEVTTPEQANIIAGGAFRDDTVLKKITLHDNVILACDSAFEGSALEEVVIGKYFRSIGRYIFKDCLNLTTVTFSYEYNISYLGTGMFQGCTALESIDLSTLYNLQLINPYAFYGCTNLSKVDIPYGQITAMGLVSNFTAVGEYAFAECTSLDSIIFPSTIAMLDAHCFENSAISSVSLSASLQILGEYAFANCDNLETINLRGMTLLTTIEEGVFMDCDSLRYVSLSDYVTEIKDSAFENCDELVYVDFGVTVSSVLTTIGNRVFADCSSLRKIVLNGGLNADIPVTFGTEVFLNAGYTLDDGVFRTPVIYVQVGSPNYSATSKWKNGNVMYSYVEIYGKVFADTEYASMSVKPIDKVAPELTVTSMVLYFEASEENKEFDLLAYFREINLFSVTDNDSASENCDIDITSVKHIAKGEEVNVPAEDGKYDLSATGTYAVTLVASDEYGNTKQVVIQIVVA